MGIVKRSIVTMLGHVDFQKEDWVSLLPAVLIGLRFLAHSATGFAPFTVCCG